MTGAGNTTIGAVIGTTSGHPDQDRRRHPRALGRQHLHRGDHGQRRGGPGPVEHGPGHDRDAGRRSRPVRSSTSTAAGSSIAEPITSVIGAGTADVRRASATSPTPTRGRAPSPWARAARPSDPTPATLTVATGAITGNTRPLTVTGAGNTTISRGHRHDLRAPSTKTGAGTLTLSATNTYTGGTTVSAGVVRVQSNAALGTAGGGTTVAVGRRDRHRRHAASSSPSRSPAWRAAGATASAGALRNLANANTWSGAITLGGRERDRVGRGAR